MLDPSSILQLVLLGLLLVVSLMRNPAGPIQRLEQRLGLLEQMQDRSERVVRDELAGSRRELAESAARSREETGRAVKDLGDSLLRCVGELFATQKGQFDSFAEQLARLASANEQTVERLRRTVEERLKDLQADNSKKLDEMRQTVDEKLQGTLDKRLGESFRQVSERLEQVHKGLGEMQSLAVGVGDLKRVLTNVKLRGAWGEIQLESLLEQVLSPEQYEKNVAVRPGGSERVEFCIRLPGRSADLHEVVWLPIDAKFPHEDYQRLVDAEERADPEAQAAAARQLETRIKGAARDIRDKYIHPPHTTDFAILFLPTEGLYAEAVRRPDLIETLQRDCRVVVAGPTTLAALLNSLQMGFRALAIEKRSSEVWTLLATVKTEFEKFGEIIGRVQKKLQEAANVIDQAATKSRTIERKLRGVQQLPAAEHDPDLLAAADADVETSEPAAG